MKRSTFASGWLMRDLDAAFEEVRAWPVGIREELQRQVKVDLSATSSHRRANAGQSDTNLSPASITQLAREKRRDRNTA